jgi:hypothetical protein
VVGAIPMLEVRNSARETSISVAPNRVGNARIACGGRSRCCTTSQHARELASSHSHISVNAFICAADCLPSFSANNTLSSALELNGGPKTGQGRLDPAVSGGLSRTRLQSKICGVAPDAISWGQIGVNAYPLCWVHMAAVPMNSGFSGRWDRNRTGAPRLWSLLPSVHQRSGATSNSNLICTQIWEAGHTLDLRLGCLNAAT